ncbi:MAG: type IV pili methyl-accepting chemotaxis transducer N-terminal domain-containing protein [Rhodobacteraceae bacterium]|nr:type IV pili methyl-accepting chemotaxis transducer N-terminal domain-containing protein [Paracoccaceae bacterium]
MSRSKRVVATIIVALSFALPFQTSSSAAAQIENVREAAIRINIAGRQRMLMQRMSKAACFVHLGVNTEAHLEMLASASDLFARSHLALLHGDPDLGISQPERDLTVQRNLLQVRRRWDIYLPFVASILESGTGDQETVTEVAAGGRVLLRRMEETVSHIVGNYSSVLPDVPQIQTNTFNMAARQRMLSQRAGAEFCLIEAGIYVEANTKNLAETIMMFSNTLAALIDGMPGMISAPPNEFVLNKLREVESAWSAPFEVLTRASMGAQISDADRLIVVDQLEQALILMNEAVGLYVEAR